MKVEEAAGIILDARAKGLRSPPALLGKLGMDEAYRTQQLVAERLIEGGERQTGWKIAGNSPGFRRLYDNSPPIRGYLFESVAYQSGQSIDYGALTTPPLLESELCFTMGGRLAGRVTREAVLDAIAAVTPAFEVPCVAKVGDTDLVTSGKLDVALCVADNANNMGYVLDRAISPFPAGLELRDVYVDERRNGEVSQSGRIGEAVDDQIESIVWLAEQLGEYGLAIEPGQLILSGNCCVKPVKVAAGERWETKFSGLGSVSVQFT